MLASFHLMTVSHWLVIY